MLEEIVGSTAHILCLLPVVLDTFLVIINVIIIIH